MTPAYAALIPEDVRANAKAQRAKIANSQFTATGSHKMFVLPERPIGEPPLLIGTTVLACGLGAIFGLAVLLSIAFSEPPARSLAASPADAIPSQTSAVEAGAGNGEVL